MPRRLRRRRPGLWRELLRHGDRPGPAAVHRRRRLHPGQRRRPGPCQAEIETCLGGGGNPPPGGNLDCAGIFDCAGACNPNDQNCIQGCLAAGTAQGQDLAIQLSQCAQAADMNGEDVEVACADLINQCFGG
ncbi:MAG: hypothetical protein R3F60_07785 [bacterium]